MALASVMFTAAALAMAGIAVSAARVIDGTSFTIGRAAYTTLLALLFGWRAFEITAGSWSELVEISLTQAVNLTFPIVAAGSRRSTGSSSTPGMVVICLALGLPALLLLEFGGGVCMGDSVCLPATGVAKLYNIIVIVAVVFFILWKGGFGGPAAARGSDHGATASRRLLGSIFVAQVIDAGLSLGVTALPISPAADDVMRAGVALILVLLVAQLLLRVELRTGEHGIIGDAVPDAVPAPLQADAAEPDAPLMLAAPALPAEGEITESAEVVLPGRGGLTLVDNALLVRLQSLIESEKVFTTPGFGRQDLAEMLDVSERHLTRFFSAYVGMPVNDYLNNFRIEFAKTLLVSGDKPITEIAFDSGFNSLSSFYRCFKEATGRQPGQYRADERPVAEIVSLTSFARRSSEGAG
jgi:AraC-like DNA-binding protein